MQKRLRNAIWAPLLALIMLSFVGATPALAKCPPNAAECIPPPYDVAAAPVWSELNGVSAGNYPGGNMEFDVMVVNSDQPPDMNFTLINETLTSPAFPAFSNSTIGLPVNLAPGQLIVNTMALPIPSNFSQANFTADLVADGALWNGTASTYLQLKSTTVVTMLGPPITSTQTTTTTTTITQAGTVSSSLLAAGVAIPSIVAVILLALFVRGRDRPGGA